MKHHVRCLLTVLAIGLSTANAFTTPQPLVSRASSNTQLQYNHHDGAASGDAFRDRMNSAYQDWCQLHGRNQEASRKEIFGYHFLLAERFFQNTGVRLELNENAHLTDQEYAGLLQQKFGQTKLSRPPAMEAEHQRFHAAYKEWCASHKKEMDMSRLEIFSYHHLMAEKYLEETGTVLQLNEYADRTQEEYEQVLKELKKAKAESATTTSTSAAAPTTVAKVATEEPQIATTPPPQQQQEQQPQKQDFRTKDWWDGSGSASNFADWWEGGSSLTSARYERPRSAKARWQQQETKKDFWGFLGDDQQGSVAPAGKAQDATTKNVPASTSSMTSYTQEDSVKGTVSPTSADLSNDAASPSSMTSYAPDAAAKSSPKQEKDAPPLSSNPYTTKDAASPSSMTSYVQEASSKSPLQDKPITSNSADWWGSGSIAQMKPISNHTDMRGSSDDGGEPRAPRVVANNPPEMKKTKLETTVNSAVESNDDSSASLDPQPPAVSSTDPSETSSSTTAEESKSYLDTLNPIKSFQQSPEPKTEEQPPKSYLDTLHPIKSFQGPTATTTSESSSSSSFQPSPKTESRDDWWTKASISPPAGSYHQPSGASTDSVRESVPSEPVASDKLSAESSPPVFASEDAQEYVAWCQEHGKEPTEERKTIFVRNLKWAKEYSEQSGVELEMNEYADLTEQEYKAVLAAEEEEEEEEEQAMPSAEVKPLEVSTTEQDVAKPLDVVSVDAAATPSADQQVVEKPLEVSSAAKSTPMEVVSVGDGPSTKSSVFTSRKQLQKDRSEFQERLLAARIQNDIRFREHTKALAVQLQKYFFQRRLLAARIEYDAKAKAAQAAQSLESEQASLESASVVTTAQSDVKILDEVRDLQAEARQSAFQQRLLAARIKYDTAASLMEKAKKESAFQQELLGARIKNDFIASQQRTKENIVSSDVQSSVGDVSKETKDSTTSTSAPSSMASDSKVSMQEKLYEAKVEKHFSKDSKADAGSGVTESIEKADAFVEPSSATPAKSIEGSTTTVEEPTKVEAVESSKPTDAVVEASLETIEAADTTVEDVTVPATSVVEKAAAESAPTRQIEAGSAVSISSTDELLFEYTSPYQGLTGPSKAGLVLATLLAIGMVVTSPELDLASQVDWSQPGLADFATVSGAAQHAVKDFVHNIQDGFAGVTKSLSEGIHAASQKLMGGLESVKESTARSMDGMGDRMDSVKESTSRSVESVSERMSAPKSDPTASLKEASNSLSSWKADRAQQIQEVGKAAEKSTRVLKESTVSSVKTAATNTFQEVKQNTPSVIKEVKPIETATNVVRELKQSPAASVMKEVKPSTAAKVIKEVAAPSSSTDLSSMLSDWNAQQK